MSDLWYESLLNEILESKADILMIVDKIHAFNSSDFREKVKEHYQEIIDFENEIELRRKIRKSYGKLIVVFDSEKQIPYDLEKKYATLEFHANNIFPSLDKETILQEKPNNFQTIYQLYSKRIEGSYQNLTKSETRELIEEALTNKTSNINNDSLKEKIKELLTQSVITEENWGEIGQKIGELSYIKTQSQDQGTNNLLPSSLSEMLDDKLRNFVLEDYEDLIYSPKSRLNSDVIDRVWGTDEGKIALICLDAMGFLEWKIIQNYLKEKLDIRVNVSYSFSILPSITSYSRTALFSGLRPKKIKEHLDVAKISTRFEEKLFKKKMEKMKKGEHSVFFGKYEEPRNVDFDKIKNYENVGLIFFFVDKNVHKSINKYMLAEDLKVYLENSMLDELVKELLEEGYSVWFSSDHGNIHCKGNNIAISNDLTEEKAKRCAIFNQRNLAYEKKSEKSEILQLDKMNGEEFLLLLTDNVKFGKNGEKRGELSHGGLSVEEMIVPLVEVTK